jgi:DUF4097 and DUF4098 domain-containing protein YvlB
MFPMKARLLLALVAAAALTAPASAQDGHVRASEWLDWLDCDKVRDHGVKHCESVTREWKPTGTPIVVDSSPNGGAIVIGWDRDVVQVEAILHARGKTQREADDVAAEVEIEMKPGRITATGPEDGAQWSVTFVIHAPRNSDLRLTAYNGPVGVENVNGEMELATHNGPISLVECGGDVRAQSQNGPLTVTLAGRAWDGAGLDAETRNGPVNLKIPERYSATLESGTLNGPMDIDIPVRIRRGQYFTTELGEGGTALRVVTRNGPIQVRRI